MSLNITIIGAGPGGYVAAIRAAQLGAHVTVVEDREVGGTCLNWGCIPTKSLIASAAALRTIRHAQDFGIVVNDEVRPDLDRIRARTDKVVSTQVKGIREIMRSWGVKLIAGRGSLIDGTVARAVLSDGTTMDLRSDRIIIATGSRPAGLPGMPSDGKNILTSDDAVRMRSIPPSVLIVGAGAIGCEFAFLYQALGSEVTLIEAASRVIPSEDEEIAKTLEREFKKARIGLHTGVRIGSLSTEGGTCTARLSNGKVLTAAQVLVSVGRSLNTEGLGLEVLEIRTGSRGEIMVNDRMETSAPGVYAIGDVTGRMMLAHVASHQGLVAAENALGGSERMEYDAVPAGIFTHPEIGSVGLREFQAAERGISVRVGRFPYRTLGKAHADGEIAGMVKVLADASTDRVLGVHIIGSHAADIVHEGALAMRMGATARQLAGMIHAHPTVSEAVMEAAGDVHGAAIHVLRPRER